MMTYFYEIESVWQILLLVLSQVTVIVLLGNCILTFKNKSKVALGFDVCVIILNTALYIIMQIDSNVSFADKSYNIHAPYILLLIITIISLAYAIYSALKSTRNRDTINNTSIKEAFDNMPSAVCFFNEEGLPILCNYQMHKFSFDVNGRDVQYISDLEDMLNEDFVPSKGVMHSGKLFVLPDGSAWKLEKQHITDVSRTENIYTQFTAVNVTDLENNRAELIRENAQLRRVQADLKRLSANVVAITREEEILNAKMRVHDEMGRCLVEAQKYLKENSVEDVPEDLIMSWQRAVSMLKYNNEAIDEEMLEQIRKTCESLNIKFVQTGHLPEEENIAYILTCAVRECVTNAVRHAEASELYADFENTKYEAGVSIWNNGKQPNNQIVEGGGLSTLRMRVERAGGTMIVQSAPEFKMIVTVPKGKEGVL